MLISQRGQHSLSELAPHEALARRMSPVAGCRWAVPSTRLDELLDARVVCLRVGWREHSMHRAGVSSDEGAQIERPARATRHGVSVALERAYTYRRPVQRPVSPPIAPTCVYMMRQDEAR